MLESKLIIDDQNSPLARYGAVQQTLQQEVQRLRASLEHAEAERGALEGRLLVESVALGMAADEASSNTLNTTGGAGCGGGGGLNSSMLRPDPELEQSAVAGTSITGNDGGDTNSSKAGEGARGGNVSVTATAAAASGGSKDQTLAVIESQRVASTMEAMVEQRLALQHAQASAAHYEDEAMVPTPENTRPEFDCTLHLFHLFTIVFLRRAITWVVTQANKLFHR